MPNRPPELTVTRVVAAHRLPKSPVGVTVHRRRRERWAMALKLEGKTYYTVNEQVHLCDSTHPILLSRGCTYSWKCVEPGDCMIIEFDAPQSAQTLFSFEVQDNTPITTAFAKLEKLLAPSPGEAQMECIYLLYGALLALCQTGKAEYVPKNRQDLLQPATQYILTHYSQPGITNDFLAGLCGISTIYFRKTFTNVYGISPIHYLHRFRITKAKAMLLSDYESIEQIAESVGYNSIYHFSKMFRHYTGCSPTQYAKSPQG